MEYDLLTYKNIPKHWIIQSIKCCVIFYMIYMELFMFYVNETVIEPEKALPNSIFILDGIITENQGMARSYFSRG